jgi:hypothetical protein
MMDDEKNGGGGVGIKDSEQALSDLLKYEQKPKAESLLPGSLKVERLFLYDELLDFEIIKRYLDNPKQEMLCYIPTHKVWFPKFFFPKNTGLASIDRTPNSEDKVWGVTINITGQDLTRLERYKGAPNRCHVCNVIVFDRGERRYPARTFVVSVPDPEPSKPSKEYLSLMVEGARGRGLPEDYVKMLESFETLD